MHSKPVILIHGLLRTRYSMWYLARHLKMAGYSTYLFGYNSRHETIHQHAARLRDYIDINNLAGETIHFVTHSLGSIVLRKYLLEFGKQILPGRAVNLGPPHQGSKTAMLLGRCRIVRYLLGPSFIELGDLKMETTISGIELGVIAGTIRYSKGFYRKFLGRHDGVVGEEETKLSGMKDHITVPATHSLMPYNKEVIRQTVRFLEQGSFFHVS